MTILEKLKQENIELKNKNEELSFEISNYKINEDSLSKKIAELQEENERLKAVSGGNAANDEEIDRLKTLVTQLVDNQFDDSYVQTQDTKINEMTASIVSRKKNSGRKRSLLTFIGAGRIRSGTFYRRYQAKYYQCNG